ncbi:hypothetical protein E4U42_008114 [Claviceps africana]|uniref:Uncharacterized protein n=1 Tax=Claviceps africana TaxID=83212 RepID=A0A8K0NEC7_9HYPO|nr:hypothetical protein E4U42_008114 [Claviceps africana]
MDTHRGAPKRAPRHQHLRSRDENQERAYIAASRRTDRSIEARLQSARKASELHQKRTGKALRITEQIVFNDETYEEEDSWLPSRFLLRPQLQTPSADLNARVEAFLEQKLVMSTFVAAAERRREDQRWGEIDRLFAESFPHAAQTARRLAEDLVPPAPAVLDVEGEQNPAASETSCPDAMPGSEPFEPVFSSDLPAGADDASFFTTDLPAEVLLFLGHDPAEDQVPGLHEKGYGDSGLKPTGHAPLGAVAVADAASLGYAVDSAVEPLQRPTAGEEESIWSDELDAYLDSSAWLDFPAEEQTFT